MVPFRRHHRHLSHVVFCLLLAAIFTYYFSTPLANGTMSFFNADAQAAVRREGKGNDFMTGPSNSKANGWLSFLNTDAQAVVRSGEKGNDAVTGTLALKPNGTMSFFNADDQAAAKSREKGNDSMTGPSTPKQNGTINFFKSDAQAAVQRGGLVHDSGTGDQLVESAVAVSGKWGSVLFTFVNDAYLPFAHSWLCNTAPFPHLHQRVLFLVTDVTTGAKLRQRWPDVTVVTMKDSEGLSGNQQFSRVGYSKIMIQRTRWIQRMLQAGVTVFLFEVDAVWLRDPLPFITSQAEPTEIDVVGVKLDKHKYNFTCGGFIFLKPTKATRQVWTRLTELMEQLYLNIVQKNHMAKVSGETNDQTYLSQLLEQRYAGVNRVYVPGSLFPEGKWYFQNNSVTSMRKKFASPMVIQNNWINGNANKIRRAKRFGHWFTLNSTQSHIVICDEKQVHKITGRK